MSNLGSLSIDDIKKLGAISEVFEIMHKNNVDFKKVKIRPNGQKGSIVTIQKNRGEKNVRPK